ncbi:hypothetical protein TWF569_011974 [Orbilia oligospora]|uniref:Uncharacterized protein n=1 Tax=Orbilia oligospora TaxID=2813651 RepID=A0A7C8N3E6_ORBOL|nr:hypothetical protein TWF706_011995 [Orbilia oligospora]KAF3080837.1 hypothetical protein TWF102_011999 [Orbilia oligospora]KAF3090235.1 hypothetical protein TWF103_012028 [Orbilia oligospora]KAF3123556.1 hypothetical protein TWF594_011856 [Orbilia oligospora]KAF3140847.1 hypothetical protein TWF569_011974 [Orbilia oligospora]
MLSKRIHRILYLLNQLLPRPIPSPMILTIHAFITHRSLISGNEARSTHFLDLYYKLLPCLLFHPIRPIPRFKAFIPVRTPRTNAISTSHTLFSPATLDINKEETSANHLFAVSYKVNLTDFEVYNTSHSFQKPDYFGFTHVIVARTLEYQLSQGILVSSSEVL